MTKCRLVVLTLASLLCIFSSFVGLTGVVLNSRPILAFYNLLSWPTLLSLCLVGYTSYKRGALSLDRKLNQAWSQFLDDEERLPIQNSLRCCGYYNPLRTSILQQSTRPRKANITKGSMQTTLLIARNVIPGQPCRGVNPRGLGMKNRLFMISPLQHSPSSPSI